MLLNVVKIHGESTEPTHGGVTKGSVKFFRKNWLGALAPKNIYGLIHERLRKLPNSCRVTPKRLINVVKSTTGYSNYSQCHYERFRKVF